MEKIKICNEEMPSLFKWSDWASLTLIALSANTKHD